MANFIAMARSVSPFLAVLSVPDWQIIPVSAPTPTPVWGWHTAITPAGDYFFLSARSGDKGYMYETVGWTQYASIPNPGVGGSQYGIEPAISPDGNTLVLDISTSQEYSVPNLVFGQTIGILEAPKAYAHDGTELYIANGVWSVRRFDSGSYIELFPAFTGTYNGAITSIQVSKDGTSLAVVGGTTLRVFNTSDQSEIYHGVFTSHGRYVSWANDDMVLAIATQAEGIYLLDTANWGSRLPESPLTDSVTAPSGMDADYQSEYLVRAADVSGEDILIYRQSDWSLVTGVPDMSGGTIRHPVFDGRGGAPEAPGIVNRLPLGRPF